MQHVNIDIPMICKYSLAASSVPKEGTLGTAVYVHHKVTFDNITLKDDYLQSSVLKLNLPQNKIITLCNIYNQPSQHYNLNQLPSFLSKLQQPLMVLGDFNAHHPL